MRYGVVSGMRGTVWYGVVRYVECGTVCHDMMKTVRYSSRCCSTLHAEGGGGNSSPTYPPPPCSAPSYTFAPEKSCGRPSPAPATLPLHLPGRVQLPLYLRHDRRTIQHPARPRTPPHAPPFPRLLRLLPQP